MNQAATITCRHCRAFNVPGVGFCSACGKRMPAHYLGLSASKWVGFAVALAVIYVVLMGLLYSRQQASITANPTPAPSPVLSASERLKNAKVHIADHNFDKALVDLKAIPKSAVEYKEAQQLIPSAQKENQAREDKTNLQSRRDFIREAEDKFLNEGYDVYVSLSGPNETTITFRYVLMSRPVVYQVINNDTEFMDRLRSIGFKKAIFTDGYDHT